jgi:hypothetical protein
MNGAATFKRNTFCACTCNTNYPANGAFCIFLFCVPRGFQEILHFRGQFIEITIENIKNEIAALL